MGGIVKQGKQCVDEFNSCVYSDGKGNYCVIGHGLDETNPKLMMSNEIVYNLIEIFINKIPEHIKNHPELFQNMQRFNDANKKQRRANFLERISDCNLLDMDKPYWQQWIDLGE
jgi:hypothetical protein